MDNQEKLRLLTLRRCASLPALGLAVCLWLALFFAYSALAQNSNGVSLTAQAGFDGYCKNNAWLPVRVVLENQANTDLDGRLEVQATDASTSVYAQTITLPALARKAATLNYFLEGYFSNLNVRFIAQDKKVAETTVQLSCTNENDLLVGILSKNPSTFNSLASLNTARGKTAIAQIGPASLPDQAANLEALDVLVFSGIDSGILTAAQQAALATWVAGGGRLLVTGGPEWQATVAGLTGLLPLHPEGTQTLPGLDSLAAYTGQLTPLPGESPVAHGPLAQGAEILVSQAGVPLVVQKSLGLGKVIYLAADPSLEPLKSWAGVDNFYRLLLAEPATKPVWARGFQNWNLAANAVGTLPSLALPPAPLVLGFLIVYVLAIGPANFILLRYYKRRELAWLSIPALVVLFSLLAFLLGNRSRGAQPLLNRLAIIQVWPGSDLARVDGLLGVFSPKRATYTLQVKPGYQIHAIPDPSLNQRAGSWAFVSNEQGQTNIPDLRIDVGGLNAVAIEGQMPAPSLASDLALNFGGGNASLQGKITNTTGMRLKNAVLLLPGQSQNLGDLAPGEDHNVQVMLNMNGRASPAASASSPSFPGGPVYYGGSSPYMNTLITDLVGTGDYYRNSESYLRFMLLNAITNYGSAVGTGEGIYLAAWGDGSPLNASLENQPSTAEDTSLYLFALPANLQISQDRLKYTPGLFSWSVLESNNGNSPTPYEAYLQPGSFSLSFRPFHPVPFKSVDALILNLKSYASSGPAGLQVYLWDFQQTDWVHFPNLDWGEHTIPNPERYVSPEGEIRLRLENDSQYNQVNIESADFTLEVSQ